MSDFLAGYLLGAWTVSIIVAAGWWIARSYAYQEPKPWE